MERGDGDEFCVRMHRDREITELLMTAAQVRELDPADVDLHWNTASGEIRVQPATGDAKEYFAEIPGVGEEIGRPLMLFLMERPGQLFNLWELRTDRDLAHMLNTGALAARITKIRRALGEDGQTHYFINTAKRPYRVGWSKQRSWRLIERVTQQAEAVSGARESA